MSSNDKRVEAAKRGILAADARKISVGNTVLMEYASGVVTTVIVDSIEDDIVYGTGNDGEPYCAPLDNCDKVPF